MKKRMIYILVVLLFFRIVESVYVYNFKYTYFKNEKITVNIVDIDKVSDEGVSYIVRYKRDKFILYIKDKNTIYNPGEKLVVIASNYEIEKYNNPFELDYKKYLNSKGIVSRLYSNKVISHEKVNNLNSVIFSIRELMSKKLDEKMGKKSNVLKSIIYGDDTLLEDDVKNLFSNVGVGHYLCVSGAHVIMLLDMFEYITKSRKNKILTIIMLTYFYLISFFNTSLLRAIIMNILNFSKRKLSFFSKFFIALYVIILINPYYIFNIGIIFSFLSVLGIQLFNSSINSFLNTRFRCKYLEFVYNSISVTISAQILIIPFEIYCFGKISLICIFSNIILSEVLNILMICGFSLFILFFIPFLSNILINACNTLIYILLYVLEWINHINYFNISLPRFTIPMYISYYLLVILFLCSDKIWIYFWKKKKLIKNILFISKIICMLVIILNILYINYLEDYVIYFNVGQGNMALIHKNTTNIIVDIGSTEENRAYNVISNFLKAKNIQNIDLLVITHMHTDHMNGLEALIADNNISIKRVGFSKIGENDIEEKIQEKNISRIYLKEKDLLEINKIKIEVLSPPEKLIQDTDILNANSTAILVSKNNEKYLFMGDCTKKSEKYILENHRDILQNIKVCQISHHGSNTSSYEPFISSLNCSNGVISAKKKVYGHPSDDVIRLLEKYNINIYITERNGAVIF